ncbi:MAG: septation protein IspZ [Alphaproteobacteria bacterium]|nr:septation protein IspZ [Alphaproteobacteria bacterium]
MKSLVRVFNDFAPLVGFFIAYKFYGMMAATGVVLVLSIIAMGLSYWIERKIPVMVVASTLIVLVLGAITLLSGDTSFIKMKPTILYGSFALALGIGLLKGKGLISYILRQAVELPDQAWLILSKRWMVFFALMAIANECVWRTMSESAWVQFKVFGLLGLTFAFMLSQIPFIYRHQLQPTK